MNLLDEVESDDTVIDSIMVEDFHVMLVERFGVMRMKQSKPSATASLKNFIHQHPFLTGAAISLGLNALSTYTKNKKITARFFAQNAYERKLYKDMADQLIKSGHYKMVRKKYVNGGLMYELVKG